MATTDAPRRPKSPISPLSAVLTIVVIALGAAVFALMLAPIVAGLGSGVNRVDDRLNYLGDCRRLAAFPERSEVFAADGKTELATLYLDYNREVVRLDDISPTARQAVLAIEDDGFYQHGALNFPSLVRAFVADLAHADVVQGGSTITQQLVKNAVLEDTSRTIERKFQEAAVANCLERKYSKDEILELYLNDVYFGNGVYGIGTAADFYFHEPASKLSLAQSALLAGMIRAPATYDPLAHPKASIRRRNEVLDRLGTLRWVRPKKIATARAGKLGLAKNVGAQRLEEPPFIVRYVVGQILDMSNHEYDALGATEKKRLRTLYQGGLKIDTTLDADWQRTAERAANAPWAVSPSNPRNAQVPDVAVVSLDASTGGIRTLLSGRDYDRQHRRLATALRQPGSAFKPFTLVAAFEQHVPPDSAFSSSSPYYTSLWNNSCHCVSNAEGAGDGGYLSLWRATADSVNVVFAQLELSLSGRGEAVAAAARRVGIDEQLAGVPSITLGTEEVSPLDMASAYQTFADDGVHCTPYAVERVESAEGATLFRHKQQCEQAIRPDVAHLVTAMLEGVVRDGTGTRAALGRPVAGKTGTTQDYSNAWFVGYTPQVSTAVWVGFPNTTDSMESYFGEPVFGGTLAAPIWRDYMSRVTAGMPVQGFPGPPAPETGKVPRLIGLRSLEAQRRLQSAHFTPRVEKVASDQPLNTVIRQTPAPGTAARLGSIVMIFISRGTVVLPDVVGETVARAKRSLTDVGLVVKIVHRVAKARRNLGLVLEQSPGAGKTIERGATVIITVGT